MEGGSITRATIHYNQPDAAARAELVLVEERRISDYSDPSEGKGATRRHPRISRAVRKPDALQVAKALKADVIRGAFFA